MRHFFLILALAALLAGCATKNTADSEKKPQDSTVVRDTVNPVVVKPPLINK